MIKFIEKIFEFIKNIFKKKEKLDYPRDFALIDFSEVATGLGVKGDKNKIITRFFTNRFGNLETKKYRYSEERVDILRNLHHVPVHDKTTQQIKFPIFSRILPGEINFLSK